MQDAGPSRFATELKSNFSFEANQLLLLLSPLPEFQSLS
jgi:hypothetical protein